MKRRTDRFYVAVFSKAIYAPEDMYLDPLGRPTADPLQAERFELKADASRTASAVGGLAKTIVILDGKVL